MNCVKFCADASLSRQSSKVARPPIFDIFNSQSHHSGLPHSHFRTFFLTVLLFTFYTPRLAGLPRTLERRVFAGFSEFIGGMIFASGFRAFGSSAPVGWYELILR